MSHYKGSHCHTCSRSRSNTSRNAKNSPSSLKKTFGSRSSFKQQTSSPRKGPQQLDMANRMKKTRTKLCGTLDAYLLIKQTGAPLRCIQHNSVLSLYCQTQQKLLCANCVYRSQTHRLHKVHPIDQCNKMISRDIDLMERQMERQIQSIEKIQEQINEAFKQQQKSANQAILAFAQEFQNIEVQLRKCYEMLKTNVLKILDKLCYKQQALLIQLGFFKDIYKQNLLPKQQELKANKESDLMYYHLTGNSIMNNNRAGKIKVMIEKDSIKNFQKRQMKYIKKIKDVLQQWNRRVYSESLKGNLD